MDVTRRYYIMATGFAVWTDYPDKPSRMEAHVGKLWMVARLGGRQSWITVSVDGRGAKVDTWDSNGDVYVHELGQSDGK
jgi:hypothetical protein